MPVDIPRIHYRPSIDTDIGLEVFPLEIVIQRAYEAATSPFRPHRIEFSMILLLIDGQITHSVDFETYSLKSGDALLVSSGQLHQFHRPEASQGILILINDALLHEIIHTRGTESFDRLFNYHTLSPKLSLSGSDTEQVNALGSDMLAEYGNRDAYAWEASLKLRLQLLLIQLERARLTINPNSDPSRRNPTFQRFRELVLRHCHTTRRAQDYADWLSVSYKHLNDTCRKNVNLSAKGFIDLFVVLEIKRYLASTDMSIKELTYTLGFDEPTNLVKYFKKHTGQSPRRFRLSLGSQMPSQA